LEDRTEIKVRKGKEESREAVSQNIIYGASK
jgi:hypothetical protein